MEVKRLGNLYGYTGGSYAYQVYDPNGLAPTINCMGGGGREPMIVEEVGFMDNGTGKHQSNTVYSTEGISPSITTVNGGGTQQIKIIEEPVIIASRGRSPKNPSDRTAGIYLEQRLEARIDGCTNALTSVGKDNWVLEPCEELIPINTEDDGTARTLKAQYYKTSGANFTKTGDWGATGVAKIEKIGQISSDGSQYGTVISENGIASTIAAGTHGYANSCIQTKYRIRKLTAKETWRIQSICDADFEKAEILNSNTALYKQSGNSITRNVLVAIFGQMFEGKEDEYKKFNVDDLKNGSYEAQNK